MGGPVCIRLMAFLRFPITCWSFNTLSIVRTRSADNDVVFTTVVHFDPFSRSTFNFA